MSDMLREGSDPARFVVEPERYTGPEVVPPRVVSLEVSATQIQYHVLSFGPCR